MNIQNKKLSKKPLLIIAIAVALCAIGAATYVYAFDGNILGWTSGASSRKNGIDYGKPTNEQIEGEKDITDRNIESSNNGEDANGVGSDRPQDPQPQASGKSTVNLSITAANQNESVYQIRTLIGNITSEGGCTLTLTKGSQVVTKTSGVQSLPSGSTCQGFNIPLSELSPGTWQLSIIFENSTVIGKSQRAIIVS